MAARQSHHMYPDQGLKRPVRAYADTFSAVPVVKGILESAKDPEAVIQSVSDAIAEVMATETVWPNLMVDRYTTPCLVPYCDRPISHRLAPGVYACEDHKDH